MMMMTPLLRLGRCGRELVVGSSDSFGAHPVRIARSPERVGPSDVCDVRRLEVSDSGATRAGFVLTSPPVFTAADAGLLTLYCCACAAAIRSSRSFSGFPLSGPSLRFRKFGLLNDWRLAVLTSLRESAARPSSLRVALRRAEVRTLVKACDSSTRCSPTPSSSSAANLVLHEDAAAL